MRKGGDLYLNVAASVSKEPLKPKRETLIERALVGDYAEKVCEAFQLHCVDRQFPVGLYRTYNLKQPIFTAGTSAIDIVGVKGDEFTLIELKAGNNIAVGAVSELLFYASVIRDAASISKERPPVFQFGRGSAGRSKVKPDDVQKSARVRAVLLAEQFHPLLEHPKLFATLTDAAGRQEHPVPLSFERWHLSEFDDGHPHFKKAA